MKGHTGPMDEDLANKGPRGFDSFELTLGDEMRGERATLGKSLLDVQRDLRIKATYVSAIENSDLSVFQTQSFIAGYVRSYARYLKMEPDECFVRFCEESGFSGVHSDIKSGSLSTKPAVITQTSMRVSHLDPIAQPRISRHTAHSNFLSNLSLSALGSVTVLAFLIVGLGYGGWTVLKEVQRVRLVPVNQTPSVTSEVVGSPADINTQPSTIVGIKQQPSVQIMNLDQLYRPQEFEVPKMVARDGPIASINAGSLGAYAEQKPPSIVRARTRKLQEKQPPRVIANGPPPVDLIALKAAWVRIYFEDGSILFEKILDAGESYRLPANVDNPLLRAGNAGAVFVKVGDVTHGPLGKPGGVVRGVVLNRENVTKTLALAVDFVQPSSPPLNIGELNSIDSENAIVDAGSN
ncbi:MAG: DUF4115 domain-containing protein [Amylibacter sp.]|nr:DUF4115 domain-containing protein [Amylibacter sp.]